MTRFALIAALSLLAGLAQAGTFELSDPANEMMEERNAPQEAPLNQGEVQPAPVLTGDTLCTVDTDSGACSCIDKKMARKLSLSQDQCAAQVLQALKIHQP